MNIKEVVKSVADKFEYVADSKFPIDQWFVMREKNGKLHGDCDDFAITCLYYYYGFWGFIWNVCITHKGKLHRFKTSDGQFHVGASVDGLWFDNYTLQAVPKSQFFKLTGHTYLKRYWIWHFWLKLFVGLFARNMRRNP